MSRDHQPPPSATSGWVVVFHPLNVPATWTLEAFGAQVRNVVPADAPE
jgi:hypothetical protein